MPGRARPRRSQPTPKGAAARGLEHAKSSFADFRRITDPNEKTTFVDRLNDFLRAAKTVPEFLVKEPRGSTQRIYNPQHRGFRFMCSWIDNYVNNLSRIDRERFHYLLQLRAVSTHDFIVIPDRANISVHVHGSLRFEHDSGMPGAENFIQSTQISAQYFFSDRPQEDVVTLCERLVQILEKLVSDAYSTNP